MLWNSAAWKLICAVDFLICRMLISVAENLHTATNVNFAAYLQNPQQTFQVYVDLTYWLVHHDHSGRICRPYL